MLIILWISNDQKEEGYDFLKRKLALKLRQGPDSKPALRIFWNSGRNSARYKTISPGR